MENPIDLAQLAPADKTLLLLDDDAVLRNRLGRALEARGFVTTLVSSVAEAIAAVKSGGNPILVGAIDARPAWTHCCNDTELHVCPSELAPTLAGGSRTPT